MQGRANEWAVAVAPGALKDERKTGAGSPPGFSGLAIRRLRAHWPRDGRAAWGVLLPAESRSKLYERQQKQAIARSKRN